MRRTVITAAMLLLLGSALPVQASANWFNSWYGYDYSPSTSPGYWYNPSFEQPRTSPGSVAETTPAIVPEIAPKLAPELAPELAPKPAPTPGNHRVEKIIDTGMGYWGTPYEFGSDRSNTSTFDCSDFVRHIFKEAANITLPSDSRKQGSYVQDLRNDVNRISELKRGDLMFFMSYQGSDSKDYAGINKSKQRITHVGIYLGAGEILHTYSEDSGGVRTNLMTDSAWEHRFLFGGSALE